MSGGGGGGAGRPARRAAAAATAHLTRSASWNGLRSGDRVIVSGLGMRGVEWEFRAHVVNGHNGSESVEVIGGRTGDRRIRTFRPERIFAVTKRARTKGAGDRAIIGELSVAEAPQLPLS